MGKWRRGTLAFLRPRTLALRGWAAAGLLTPCGATTDVWGTLWWGRFVGEYGW